MHSRSSRLEVFCKKGVLRNLTKFTGKHLCQSLFFNKVAGLRAATLLKKRLWHRCFPVNFVKFLRTPFYTEHLFTQNTSGGCFWHSLKRNLYVDCKNKNVCHNLVLLENNGLKKSYWRFSLLNINLILKPKILIKAWLK